MMKSVSFVKMNTGILLVHNHLLKQGELPALYQILTYSSLQNVKGSVATVSNTETETQGVITCSQLAS